MYIFKMLNFRLDQFWKSPMETGFFWSQTSWWWSIL